MKRTAILVLACAWPLAACDLLQRDQVEVSGNAATANASSGNASAAATPSSAGITSSRSLAGLTGGGTEGGKDPAAIQAGAGDGAVDPRLVGRWTDTGDCKAVMELRPDGTFLASNGLEGRWRVDGGALNFSANGEIISLRLDTVEPDRIVTTNAEGNSGPSTRC